MKLVFRHFVIFALFACSLFAQSPFQLNANLGMRNQTGIETGNILDIGLAPTLELTTDEGFSFGARAAVNIPYNLSTNSIRKFETTIGHIFNYAYVAYGGFTAAASVIENYSLGYTGMTVSNYSTTNDEANRKVGLYGAIETEMFGVNAMTNDVSNPEVYIGSVTVNIMDNFRIVLNGGMDSDPDNNSATTGSAAAYGADIVFLLPFDENATNFMYAIGGAGAIKDAGNGLIATGGIRVGDENTYLDGSGSLVRMGQGYTWGYFDQFYESDRRLGVSKTDDLYQKYTEQTGGFNFNVTFTHTSSSSDYYGSRSAAYEQFSVKLVIDAFANAGGTDQNKFNTSLAMNLPLGFLDEEYNPSIAPAFYYTTRDFVYDRLLDRLGEPNTQTLIGVNLPITLNKEIFGVVPSFIVDYSWGFVFQSSTSSFIARRDLKYGFSFNTAL